MGRQIVGRNITGLAITSIKLGWSQKLILVDFLAVNIGYRCVD